MPSLSSWGIGTTLKNSPSMMDRRCGAANGGAAVILTPPVRGLAFFADATQQSDVDRWWSSAVPLDAQPVYLLMHEGSPPRLAGRRRWKLLHRSTGPRCRGPLCRCPGHPGVPLSQPPGLRRPGGRDFRDTGVFDQAATARILGLHSDRARDQNRLAYPPQALADAPEQAASRPEPGAARRLPAAVPRGAGSSDRSGAATGRCPTQIWRGS